MKVVNKTYKFRLYPNAEQEVLLSKHFGCSRFVFNYFLNERKEQYKKDKNSDNYYKQAKTLTDLKKDGLDTAYVNFFRGNAHFPKFKSKKNIKIHLLYHKAKK